MYADKESYKKCAEKYGFDPFLNGEISKHIALAQVKIDELTFGRIRKIGFENLTDFQKEMVRDAVCVQAEYVCENGYGDNSEVQSYSVLDISVSVSESKSESGRLGVSPLAFSLLKQSGLMERLC